jgi:hypothetical protein
MLKGLNRSTQATVGADKGDDTSDFTRDCRQLRAMAMLASGGTGRVGSGFERLRNRRRGTPTLSEQLNDAMVRHEYFAAASDDIPSLKRAAPWLTRADAFAALADLPLAVVTRAKPFPGPFLVLAKSWGQVQAKLAALSTDSLLLVADQANHMEQHDQPEVVIEAIRSVVARTGARAALLEKMRDEPAGAPPTA